MQKNNQNYKENFISFNNVTKKFITGSGTFTALDNVSFTLKRGEFATIVGRSGSGKSTLLNMLAAIDRPSDGEVIVDQVSVQLMSENEASLWRRTTTGIVFQFFQLLPTLTILENVMLPMEFAGLYSGKRVARAKELLSRVGVDRHAGKLPSALSGGEQQRAAVARALANDPALILADEPTGNLDTNTAKDIFNLLNALSKEGKTVIVVTHEKNNIEGVGKTLSLANGAIVG
jgi:putative ABC transport system ATP-binding protein